MAELTVLTYNVLQSPTLHTAGRRRAAQAASVVTRLEPDVLVLNEVNGLAHAGRLISTLRRSGYESTPQVGALFGQRGWSSTAGNPRAVGRIAGGGIRVLSRWPLIEQHQHIFAARHRDTWDAWANVGCALARIEAPTGSFWMAGTHLQADQPPIAVAATRAVRMAQLTELREFVATTVPSDQPVLIAGDFNIEYYSTLPDGSPGLPGSDLAEAEQVLCGSITPDGAIHDFTFDAQGNQLVSRHTPAYRNVLDYIGWVDESGVRPHAEIVTRTVRESPAETASDHYPVLAWVELPQKRAV